MQNGISHPTSFIVICPKQVSMYGFVFHCRVKQGLAVCVCVKVCEERLIFWILYKVCVLHPRAVAETGTWMEWERWFLVSLPRLCAPSTPRWDAGDCDSLFFMLVTSIFLLLQNSSKMIPLPHLQLSHPAINQLEKHCVYRYINIINIYIYIFLKVSIFQTTFFHCFQKLHFPPSVFAILPQRVILKHYGSFLFCP